MSVCSPFIFLSIMPVFIVVGSRSKDGGTKTGKDESMYGSHIHMSPNNQSGFGKSQNWLPFNLEL